MCEVFLHFCPVCFACTLFLSHHNNLFLLTCAMASEHLSDNIWLLLLVSLFVISPRSPFCLTFSHSLLSFDDAGHRY